MKHWGNFSDHPFYCGKPFVLSELANSPKQVSCYLCLLYGWNNLERIRKGYPELKQKLEELKKEHK
jgi:hypothetical protein